LLAVGLKLTIHQGTVDSKIAAHAAEAIKGAVINNLPLGVEVATVGGGDIGKHPAVAGMDGGAHIIKAAAALAAAGGGDQAKHLAGEFAVEEIHEILHGPAHAVVVFGT